MARFRAAFGPTARSFALAEASLRAQGFTVTGRSTQSLRVRATAATLERAFATQLGVKREARGVGHIAAMRPFRVMPEFAALGATVTGIENLPRHHVHSTRVPLNRYAQNGGYWFTDLNEAYSYPQFATLGGKGGANVSGGNWGLR